MRKNSFSRVIALFLVLTMSACHTSTQETGGDVASGQTDDVYVTNFSGVKSNDALFVHGTLVNKHGSTISNVILEARGYDKDNKLVSTDEVTLSPEDIPNKESVNFSMTFTTNSNLIETYYILGKYGSTLTNRSVDWKTVGKVVLVVAVVSAVAVAAYYADKNGGGQSSYSPMYDPCDCPVYVTGYYRLDGTYVKPYCRTAPDDYIGNNWSSRGNINPCTGERGYE